MTCEKIIMLMIVLSTSVAMLFHFYIKLPGNLSALIGIVIGLVIPFLIIRKVQQ